MPLIKKRKKNPTTMLFRSSVVLLLYIIFCVQMMRFCLKIHQNPISSYFYPVETKQTVNPKIYFFFITIICLILFIV